MQRTDSLEKPWCWEWLEAGGEGDDRGWDVWKASPTQWTWVWRLSFKTLTWFHSFPAFPGCFSRACRVKPKLSARPSLPAPACPHPVPPVSLLGTHHTCCSHSEALALLKWVTLSLSLPSRPLCTLLPLPSMSGILLFVLQNSLQASSLTSSLYQCPSECLVHGGHSVDLGWMDGWKDE